MGLWLIALSNQRIYPQEYRLSWDNFGVPGSSHSLDSQTVFKNNKTDRVEQVSQHRHLVRSVHPSSSIPDIIISHDDMGDKLPLFAVSLQFGISY
jgi:hypothetical protein